MSNSEKRLKLQKALSLHQAGRLENAGTLYREIIAEDPKDSQAVHYLGLIEAAAGRFQQAAELLHRSLTLEPQNIQFVENYATVVFQAGQYRSALEIAERGLRLDGSYPPVLYVQALALHKLGRFQDAIAAFDKVLVRAPKHLAAINERGSALAELGDYDGALAAFDKALALEPRYAEAHVNKANIFGALKRYEAALAAYDKALALKPALAEAWLGRGQVLGALDRYSDAMLAYDKALAIRPGFAQALVGRGNILVTRKSYEAAFAAFDKALALDPELDYAPVARLFAKLCLCDWTNLQAETAQLAAAISRGRAASTPFQFLPVASSAQQQRQCTERHMRDGPHFPPLWRGEIHAHDRIRIAYLSADFREHPVAYLVAGLMEHHDKSRFEITALSVGPDQDSPMRRRIRAAVEHFIDGGVQSDEDIATLLHSRQTDIVVDLVGHTLHNRLGMLARRPAPVQVNYLGYSATMGVDCIDYILADATVVPEEHCACYSEQVVWLPDCYLVNDDLRTISERTPSRRECGLPDDTFVFCCFNNSYKLGPETFQVWMRLLQATEGSVLWLSEANLTAQNNLRREAEQCGVAGQRLIFAPRLPEVADHLARQRNADLFLDTLPYNAHTTACDALWAGLPLITCLGSTFVGRVAASLLRAVGLDELVTTSLQDYEALASKLAHQPVALASVKDKLARNRTTHPLFDTARTTRQIESAYTMMWERYQMGESARSAPAKPIRIVQG